MIEAALREFAHASPVAGGIEHRDGVFEDPTERLRRHSVGVTVLERAALEIDGLRIVCSTH